MCLAHRYEKEDWIMLRRIVRKVVSGNKGEVNLRCGVHYILILAMLFSLAFLTACGVFQPDNQPGSLKIVLVKENPKIERDVRRNSKVHRTSYSSLSSVKCIVKKGSTTKFDGNLTKQGNNFHGEIKDLEPGSDYSVLLLGKNSSGSIIARGYKAGINVDAGSQTTVSITWASFTPVLTSPSNNSTTNDNTPYFDWSDVTGAAAYELEVDNSGSFSSPEIHRTDLTSSYYTATSSLSDGTYYWRVRAKDSNGNLGSWSGVWSFTIDTQGPSAPTLHLPSNGSTTSDNTPYFDWYDVTGAATYELEVDNSSSFSSPEIHRTSLTSSYYLASSSLSYGTYYWRVRAKDSNGNWGSWSGVWSFTIIIEWIYVQGGTFEMGSNDSESYSNEHPVHTVTVSSFYISKYEVTQKEWKEIMGNNPSYFKGDNLPVEEVSWYDAVKYCNARSKKEGLTPCYTINGNNVTCDFTANGYRLPTEAEWEYAARGGNKSKGYKYSGSDNPDDVAWYYDNSRGHTHPVGTKQPNELGIYDMSGNVWEWCWDWYDKNYYSTSPQQNPRGPSTGTYRALRGGSWDCFAGGVRSAVRSGSYPDGGFANFGFRLSRTY